MYEPEITVTGNVGADPKAKTTPSGTSVTDLRVAVTPRRRPKGSEEWVDLPTLWFQVSAWGKLGDNVAASVKKGDRVVVSGTLSVSTWKNEAGEDRSSLEINATRLGLELSRATATTTSVRTPAVVAHSDPGERPDTDPVTGEMHRLPDWAVGAEVEEPGADEVAA
ncbi:MAG: single-stranded DNA-binding protein [Mycobacteriales bacterium]|nr:single-stranded DNA-binding protein [Mycobacteriales bacterium]